jgi:hypothetical protein
VEKPLRSGEEIDGWELTVLASMNGTSTAVFGKHVAHQGAIVFVTQ